MPTPLQKSAGEARKRLTARQMLAELQESEQRFRGLFEQAPVAYHEIDRNGLICRVNRAECLLLGYDPEEILGRPAWDFVAPEEREQARASVTGKLSGERGSSPLRREFLRRDGARLTLEIHQTFIHGLQGQIDGLRVALLDVTSRQRQEEAARLAREELESRVHSRTAELARTNELLGLQYATIRALTEAPGLPAAVDRILEAICRHLHLDFAAFWIPAAGRLHCQAGWPDCKPFQDSQPAPGEGLPGEIWSRERPALTTGLRQEVFAQPPGSGPESVFAVGFPIIAGASLHGVITAFGPAGPPQSAELLQTLNLLGKQIGGFVERKSAEDALQQSERRFAIFMDHLPGVAFIKDLQRRYVYVSAAAHALLGFRPEDMLGRTDNSLFPPDAAILSRETDGYVIETRRSTEGLQELPCGAQTRSWLIYKFPILDAANNPVLIGGVAVDITERKQLEEQFRQAQKMEAMGRLAGGVAHDFNNLLTIIGGYGRMVLEQLAAEDPTRATLQLMLDAADRAAVLTGQLLAFSRRQVIQPRLINLNQIVSSVEKMLRRVIGEHIELQTILDPKIPQVKADAGQLDQILMNLAVNARDAMPEGGHLRIETATENTHVRLTVVDTGAGMNEEVKTRAFEPFFTTKGRGKGTGLGLSTVYGIVRQHGGDIRLESEPGAGTRFDITFPAVSEQAEDAAAAPRKPHSTQGTETVLLVEDDAAVRRLAHDILVTNGYRVLDAADGIEALRLAESSAGRIHLLLTDLIMPHMGGRELAAEIRKRWGGMRVLFMSGYTDDVIHADVARAANFLPKPFTPEVLTQKVRETLDQGN